ncbi:hypothetical protein [Actinomadura gamaensis]|uniref:Uncharacterized protein n=1 Tax=Actinomadura gamaensis TaxID=1763541 RepID=A0ABV9U731_9ACTN
MEDEFFSQYRRELAVSRAQEASPFGTAERALVCEELRSKSGFQLGDCGVQLVLDLFQARPRHARDVFGYELVPKMEVQQFPVRRRQRGDGTPGQHPFIDVVLVMAGDGEVRSAIPVRLAPVAFQPGEGVEPGTEEFGRGQPLDLRLGHDECVPDSDPRRVLLA